MNYPIAVNASNVVGFVIICVVPLNAIRVPNRELPLSGVRFVSAKIPMLV